MSESAPWGQPSERAGGELLVRTAPGAVEISFNRPAKHNAFTDAMYAALVQLCDEVSADQAVRAVVLTGAGGRAFAAGNDISSFTGFTSGQDGVRYEARIREVLDAIARLPQATIAAVDGICVGGGLAVANACDLRVASETARFGYPIARTLGNLLSAPIVLRCADVFGDALTREMLLASRLVSAERAWSAGAVLSVVGVEELEAEVWGIVAGIGKAAALTIALTKEQLRDGPTGYDSDFDDARLERAYGSADFAEGVRSFLAKRPPHFGTPVT